MEGPKFGDLGPKARIQRIAEIAKHFNAPEINLDCEVDPDELMQLWHAIYLAPRRVARAFFPDQRKGYVAITSWIGAYASNKATAMTCRASGNIQGAACYEDICEKIYARFPEDLKW